MNRDSAEPRSVERGRLIVFEGGDGTGKSTQARLLGKHLDALITRQPGGTPFGVKLRSILLDAEMATTSSRAEALLFMADRAEQVDSVVEPALARGQHVISDRWAYSSMAYQGYARGLDPDRLREISDWAMNGLWPDLVVLLEVPWGVSVERRERRKGVVDHFEGAGQEFQAALAAGFRKMAEADPARWRVIDASRPVDDVQAEIRQAVSEIL